MAHKHLVLDYAGVSELIAEVRRLREELEDAEFQSREGEIWAGMTQAERDESIRKNM